MMVAIYYLEMSVYFNMTSQHCIPGIVIYIDKVICLSRQNFLCHTLTDGVIDLLTLITCNTYLHCVHISR